MSQKQIGSWQRTKPLYKQNKLAYKLNKLAYRQNMNVYKLKQWQYAIASRSSRQFSIGGLGADCTKEFI